MHVDGSYVTRIQQESVYCLHTIYPTWWATRCWFILASPEEVLLFQSMGAMGVDWVHSVPEFTFQHFPFMPTGLIFYSQNTVHAPVGMDCLQSTISIHARIWSNKQISRYILTLVKMVSHCELEHSSPNNWLVCSEIHL
jgi:hypothetical protein